ncbi:Uncharacterized protein T12_11473 [Trichinella patagoniensis]|uniref:Msx2-interacting protein n=1 Tax=Trichinella patagoniensis TaxID=990121 RepID=A0A0V1A3V6_9BILA|nr:Uncharacterized protein T12_11473 [Trichinella patagoniensis]
MSEFPYLSTHPEANRINEGLVSSSKSDTKNLLPLKENNAESGILLRIDNLPPRLSDSNLKSYMSHQLKPYGMLKWLKVIGHDENRYSLVKYVRDEDAIFVSKEFSTLNFCGKTARIKIIPESEDCPDSCSKPLIYDPDAKSYLSTRTLYLGNLRNCVSRSNLRAYFEKFGPIIKVDIKSQDTPVTYGFVEFGDIKSVVSAIQHVRANGLCGWKDVKANFGNFTADNKIWIAAEDSKISFEYVTRKFWPYAPHVLDILFEPAFNHAVIVFDNKENASIAYQDIKSNPNDSLVVDYCSSQLYDSIFERINNGRSDNLPSTRQSAKYELFLPLLIIYHFLLAFSSSISPSVDDRKLVLDDNKKTDYENNKHSQYDNCNLNAETTGQTSGMNERVEDNKQAESRETSQAKRKAEDNLDVGLLNLTNNENYSKEELMKINNSKNKKHFCKSNYSTENQENQFNYAASAGGNCKAGGATCCALSPRGIFAADFRNVTYAMPSGGGNMNAVAGFIPPPGINAAYYPRPVSNYAFPDANFFYLNMFWPHFSSTLMHPYWQMPQMQKFYHILPIFYSNGERLPEEAVIVTTTFNASSLKGIYEYLARKNRSHFVLMTRNLLFFVERNVNFSTYEGINSVAQSYRYYPIVWFATISFRNFSCEIAFRCICGNFLVIQQVMSALDARTARVPGYRMASVIIEEMKPVKEASKVFFQGNDSAIAILRTDCFEIEKQAVVGSYFVQTLINPMIGGESVGFCATEELSENQNNFVVHFIPPFEFVRQHLFNRHPTAYATLHLHIANYLVCVISTVDKSTGESGNAD